jgi:ferredoxin
MIIDPYKRLALQLDALPAGFPATDDGAELRVLAALFTPEEATLAADLRPTLETAAEIAARTGRDEKGTATALKAMARRGLIKAGRASGGLRYALMPFAVGFYEMQGPVLDVELAQRRGLLPALHGEALADPRRTADPGRGDGGRRVGASLRERCEIPAGRKAWGVGASVAAEGVDRRSVRASAGRVPGDERHARRSTVPHVRALTLEEALATLHCAAEAGLVRGGNTRDEVEYVCNCCTCSCGILRGMAELGMANVVARSAFVNQVDEALCAACGACVDACSFSALALDGVAHVNALRCVGCGVCVLVCPEGALALARRPEDEVLPPPATHEAWGQERLAARGLAPAS